MKIYAISDTHFGHEKLTTLSNRPEDFTEIILEDLNRQRGDLLIHCGDFCIGQDEKWAEAFNLATVGFSKRILVRGNHDKKSDSWYLSRCFDFVCDQLVTTHFGKRVIYSHMPVFRNDKFWEPSFGPVRNIHGHLHGNMHRGEFVKDGVPYDLNYHYDLAPELHDYKVVNVESILV